MTWFENDDDLFNREYFSRANSTSPPLKFNEDNPNSLSFLNMENRLSSESDNLHIDYEEFKIQTDKDNNKSIHYNLNPHKENLSMITNESINEEAKSNIFIGRTFFDTKQLSHHLSELKQTNYNEVSLKQRIIAKKIRTKFLLTKTRRESEYTTDYVKEYDISSEKNSTENISNSNSKKENKYFKSKKEMKMQKNREAAQKSRINRKMELQMMKENQNILEEEITNLKNELNHLKCIIGKLCATCKKLLDHNNGEVNKKVKKFIISQSNINANLQNTSVNSTYSNKSKYTLLTGLLVIICLIGNLFWESPSTATGVISKSNERILLQDLNNKTLSNKHNSILPKVPSVEQLQSLPTVLIDDSYKQKSFYLKFIDYIQSKTGYTPSPYNLKVNKKEESSKRPFLAKQDKNILLKDKTNMESKLSENKVDGACINNKTFLINLEKTEEEFHSHNNKRLDFLKKDKLKEEVLCKTEIEKNQTSSKYSLNLIDFKDSKK